MAPNWDPDLVAELAGILARKWAVPVLVALWDGPLRRNALEKRVGPVSAKMLTRVLRDLEHEGLIERQVVDHLPPRVTYALTSQARALEPALQCMSEWASERPGDS